MALETLFRTGEKFSNLKFVAQIRRDPELGVEQLYLVDQITKQDDKLYLSFVQALGDAKNNRISGFTFLKRHFKSTEGNKYGLPGFAIDERERLLYVLFGGANKDNYLKIFHLRYQAPDKFGYRRIVAEDRRRLRLQKQLLCDEMPRFPMIDTMVHALSICPDTGRLVTGYMTGGFDKSLARFNWQLAILPADLIYNKQEQTAVVKAVTDRLPFMTPLQFTQFELRPSVFSRSNHLLFWQGRHKYDFSPLHEFLFADTQPTAADDGCVILRSFIPGHPANGHLNQIKIDPVQLVKSFLPSDAFGSFISQVPSDDSSQKFIGARLHLLGHVYKYVVFRFSENYILAAKWPKEWYNLSQLPPVGVSRVMLLDKEKKEGDINDVCLMSTDLYVKSELGDAQVVRRMSLDHKFKDYRHCAFCGKTEDKKKRNKKGKRMSKFKVCRMCKQLNFHHAYPDRDLGCHYCSDECQRKHWKEHKIIHKKDAKGTE